MQPNSTSTSGGNHAGYPSVGGSTPSGKAGSAGLDSLTGKVGDALQQGKEAIQSSATQARDDMAGELTQLRQDMAKMQDTIAKFASDAGGQAGKTAQDVGNAVAGEVGAAAQQVVDAGARMAATATEQAKTFASELEGMARRNPFGTLAGTLLAGVVLGMMTRGRG